jgi:hypothetical protein
MLCSLVGAPELRERFRASLGGRGPERGIATLAGYIEEEKALGRIAAEVDAKGAARVLMASSFFHVFTGELLGTAGSLDAGKVVGMVLER